MPTNNAVPDHDVIVIEDETLRQGFTQIPNAVLRRPEVTPGAKLTYMALLSYAWQEGSCFPGQLRIAEDLGVSSRSVITYLKQLQDAGLLRVKRRGLGLTNVYILSRLSAAKIESPRSRSEKFSLPEVKKTVTLEVKNFHLEEDSAQYTQKDEEPVALSPSLQSIPQGLPPSKFETAHTQKNTEPENRVDEADSLPEPTAPRRGFEAVRDVVSRLSIVRQVQPDPPPAFAASEQGSADPAQPPPTAPRRNRTRQETDLRMAIRPYLEQYAEQLGDEAKLSATVTRAVHLFERSNLTIDGFIAQLQLAQRETQRRSGSITKQRRSEGPGPRKNKMPFFFSVLEEYLGLKELPLLAASANQLAVPHREPSAPRAPRRRTVGGPMVRVDSLRHNDDDALIPPERPFSARRSPSDGLEVADGTD